MKKWLIGILIVILLIWFLNNKTIPSSLGENIGNLKENVVDKIKTTFEGGQEIITPNVQSQKEDSLMSKCKAKFKECKSITTKKYGWSVSIINIEEVNSIDAAKEFFTVWGSMGILSVDFEFNADKELKEDNLPLILIAYTVDYLNKGKLPSVAVCKKDGELTKFSKTKLSCG